jgi:hypothetical protein
VIGRPITTKLAPRSIASRGVIVRAWSSPPAESAGLTPGVMMTMSSPRLLLPSQQLNLEREI